MEGSRNNAVVMLVKHDLFNTTQPRQQKGQLDKVSERTEAPRSALLLAGPAIALPKVLRVQGWNRGSPPATDLSQPQMNHVAVNFPRKNYKVRVSYTYKYLFVLKVSVL